MWKSEELRQMVIDIRIVEKEEYCVLGSTVYDLSPTPGTFWYFLVVFSDFQ